MDAEKTIYTIGYSGFSIDEFLAVLKEYKISCLIDVRSVPNSAYFKDYNEINLKARLEENNIYYRNYAKEFGARQSNQEYYSKEGYLDFEKFCESAEFKSGMEKLRKGMRQDYRFVLMCAEKDPINCHRNIMIAREFYKAGYNVINLLPDHKEEEQSQVETRLVDFYYPNRNQLSMFECDNLTYPEMVDDSYRRKNAEIGYKVGDTPDNPYGE